MPLLSRVWWKTPALEAAWRAMAPRAIPRCQAVVSPATSSATRHAKIVVEHQHFAAGNQAAIDEDVDRIARQFVERHNRPFVQPQHVVQIHLRSAEFDFDVQLDVANQGQRGHFLRRRAHR